MPRPEPLDVTDDQPHDPDTSHDPTASLVPEKRHLSLVRLTFNPTKDPKLDDIKLASARLMTLIEMHSKDPRAAAIAITHIETAAMFGIKAATA